MIDAYPPLVDVGTVIQLSDVMIDKVFRGNPSLLKVCLKFHRQIVVSYKVVDKASLNMNEEHQKEVKLEQLEKGLGLSWILQPCNDAADPACSEEL